VKQVWTDIVPRYCWKYVDEVTVSKLELLAPAISSQDRQRVIDLMDCNMVFSTITDTETRVKIRRKLLSQCRLIPSFRTFFEDQKYLEPCSQILRSLLDDSERRPLWRAFKANYWPPVKLEVQYAEGITYLGDLDVGRDVDGDLGMKIGYLQLWLFCMRHFPELTNIKPRIDSRKKKVMIRERKITRLQELGWLAVRMGFKTAETISLATKVADWTSDTIMGLGELGICLRTDFAFTSDTHLAKARRTGRPYDMDHEKDIASLFAFMFYQRIEPGHEITPLYVKRNMFEAFLGPFIPPVGLKLRGSIFFILICS
jgi:hypothetical protein